MAICVLQQSYWKWGLWSIPWGSMIVSFNYSSGNHTPTLSTLLYLLSPHSSRVSGPVLWLLFVWSRVCSLSFHVGFLQVLWFSYRPYMSTEHTLNCTPWSVCLCVCAWCCAMGSCPIQSEFRNLLPIVPGIGSRSTATMSGWSVYWRCKNELYLVLISYSY